MKRIVALAMAAALLLCMAAAQAAEWPEGLGPAQPYVDVPEVDLSEMMGYIMFYPSPDIPAKNVCQTLYIYLPREDVKIGAGVIELRTTRDGVLQRVDMNDAERVIQRPMEEAELDVLHWGGGVCFEIQLSKSLEWNNSYFVRMPAGCIVTNDGLDSPEVNGADEWSFALTDDYGIGGIEYRRPLANGRYEAGILTPQAGDELRFDLVIGGDAVMAVLYSTDASVDFQLLNIEKSGPVTGTVTSDTPSWGVIFLDKEYNPLDYLAF